MSTDSPVEFVGVEINFYYSGPNRELVDRAARVLYPTVCQLQSSFSDVKWFTSFSCNNVKFDPTTTTTTKQQLSPQHQFFIQQQQQFEQQQQQQQLVVEKHTKALQQQLLMSQGPQFQNYLPSTYYASAQQQVSVRGIPIPGFLPSPSPTYPTTPSTSSASSQSTAIVALGSLAQGKAPADGKEDGMKQ
jgi:hypothetical protein